MVLVVEDVHQVGEERMDFLRDEKCVTQWTQNHNEDNSEALNESNALAHEANSMSMIEIWDKLPNKVMCRCVPQHVVMSGQCSHLHLGKLGDDLVQLVVEVLLSELNLSHVERPDPGYLV